MPEYRKRETGYKLQIGDILKGLPILDESFSESPDDKKEILRFVEIAGKHVVRVNVIANVIDKYISEGEKRFATLIIDDASGQIRVKAFGDEVNKMHDLNQGDTLVIIGVLRSFNKEVYILPEIIKLTDPRYLVVRKLELEKQTPKQSLESSGTTAKILEVKDQIITLIKSGEAAGGIDIEKIILELKSATPEAINSEIVKMLEEGMIYEPRPGKVRWLG